MMEGEFKNMVVPIVAYDMLYIGHRPVVHFVVGSCSHN